MTWTGFHTDNQETEVCAYCSVIAQHNGTVPLGLEWEGLLLLPNTAMLLKVAHVREQ